MKSLASVFLAVLFCFSALAAPATNADNPTGSHGLRNQQYQLFLRPRDASNQNGTPIVLYPQQPWKCMAWKFEGQQRGTRLVNYFTGKSFEVLNSSGSQALVQQPATPDRVPGQSWKFVSVGQNRYRIETEDGKGVLTAIKSDESGEIRVVIQPWKGLDSQKWELTPLPDHFTA
jgi:hypothetical protein